MHKPALLPTLALLGWLLAPFALQAQQTPEEIPAASAAKKFSLSFSPQYLAINAIRLEAELKVAEKHHIALAPYLYSGSSVRHSRREVSGGSFGGVRRNQLDADKVSGFGLEAMHKIQLTTAYSPAGLYAAYGVGYHNVRQQFDGLGVITVVENGVQTIRYREGKQTETASRFDVIGLVGYRMLLLDNVVIDLFLGPVMKFGSVSSTMPAPRDHYNAVTDYGYSGPALRAGFSVGVLLF